MQISDLVGQYSRNVANGTEELHGAQSVQKLVSTIGDLSAGSIFEGTINSVRGGKVTLALGNGQTITARLDGKMDLQQGSSMFFQVRANDGQTIAIRPYTELGNVSNPILFNALCDGGYDDAGADVDRQTEHSRYGEAGWRESGCQCADHRADDEARTPGDGGDGGAV